MKLLARFCPLAERLGTSQDRNRTKQKYFSPEYFVLREDGSNQPSKT